MIGADLRLPRPPVSRRTLTPRFPPTTIRTVRARSNGCPPLSLQLPAAPAPRCTTTTAAMASPLPLPDGALELHDEPDFRGLASPDGFLSICGFGSLLSERSARSTFPELRGFRIARLRGFRRVFRHVAPIFFQRGIAREETGEISSLSVEPCKGEELIITVFEIKLSEVSSFIDREHEFRFLSVKPEDLGGKPYSHPAVLCACYTDEEYFQIRCKGSQEIFYQRYGRFNIHRIWRDDILPCRIYLRHCVLAAKSLGELACENFLDHTFISDRITTIRQYLSSTGSGIMEEEPPEALRTRYGG